MDITLTDGQQQALDLLTDWVNNPDQQFAVLKGYAGTGKTTVLNQFGQNLRNTNIQSIVFVALSNKATKQPTCSLAATLTLLDANSRPIIESEDKCRSCCASYCSPYW